MKVRITHDGSISANHNTCVTDLETGKPIEYVTHVGLDIPADNDPVTATITVAAPTIDIIADAEIKHVCPCCGAPVETEKEDDEEAVRPFIGQD